MSIPCPFAAHGCDVTFPYESDEQLTKLGNEHIAAVHKDDLPEIWVQVQIKPTRKQIA